MKIRPVIILSILLMALMGFGLALQVHAAPAPQGRPTNTPDSYGNIYYIVAPGDTCYFIAAMYGITDSELRSQNPKINASCSNLIPGDKLQMLVSGPPGVTVTAGPSATPAPPTETPTPFAGTTEICVLLYNDLNGNALREANEPALAGGAISVAETSGKFSKTMETTINPDPTAYQGVCFTDVPEGHYNIGVAIPDNYNATTNLTYTMDVKAGDRAEVSFGAQARDTTAGQPSQPGPDRGAGPSPLLGFFGGLLLLGGLGLGYYALRLRNPQSKLKRSGLLKR